MIRPLLRLTFWLAAWLGGLAWAGRQYHACRDEGILVPGCSNPLEYVAWGTALLGLVMSARALRDIPAIRKWVG